MPKKKISKTKIKKREFWADALRATSILMVVTIHSSAKAIYEWGNISEFSWFFANLLNSFSRASVPLFVMISGAFLLNKKENLTQFTKKRLPRILSPWLVWGTVQLFYNYDFSIKEIVGGNFTSKISATYFGGFWFMPMILGLYLITPFIKDFFNKAKNKDFLYFFSLWFFFASLIPTLNNSFGINISYQLPIFINYLGYFVAGYYLTHKVKIKTNVLKQTKLLYIISTLIIAIGTYSLTKLNNEFQSSLYEYLNIPVLISTITGFIFFKSIFENKKLKVSKKLKKKIHKISQISFGIFLSHALILDILTKGKIGIIVHATITSTILAVPLTIFLVFSISTVIILMLKKYIGKYIS